MEKFSERIAKVFDAAYSIGVFIVLSSLAISFGFALLTTAFGIIWHSCKFVYMMVAYG